jgi:hypothetical protein
MPKPRSATEVILPDGRKVVIAELRLSEMKRAMQLAGAEKSEAARNFDTAVHGLRLAIRKIDGKDVKYDDLVGDLLEEHFTTKEILLLGRIFNQMHEPEEAAEGNVKAVSTS